MYLMLAYKCLNSEGMSPLVWIIVDRIKIGFSCVFLSVIRPAVSSILDSSSNYRYDYTLLTHMHRHTHTHVCVV